MTLRRFLVVGCTFYFCIIISPSFVVFFRPVGTVGQGGNVTQLRKLGACPSKLINFTNLGYRHVNPHDI